MNSLLVCRSAQPWQLISSVQETQSVQLVTCSARVSVTAKFRDYIIFGADLRRA